MNEMGRDPIQAVHTVYLTGCVSIKVSNCLLSSRRVQGEMNGHRGLVPSNFLEEVPDDVEVYLTDTPSHYPQEEPANRAPANSAAAVSEGKRVHHHRRCQR